MHRIGRGTLIASTDQAVVKLSRLARRTQRDDAPPGARILDIGGTTEYWRLMQAGSATPSWTVVVLNREVHGGSNCAWVTNICGDALALPFDDHTFDVAFSNSVIEHVGGFVQQT